MTPSLSEKTIWMYWIKSFSKAPELVQICLGSWVKKNPGWNVVPLDDVTVDTYMNMQDVREKNPRLTIQAFADLLRVRLLRDYGGVWCDATTFCNRSLDDWLGDYIRDGVFFFKTNDLHK